MDDIISKLSRVRNLIGFLLRFRFLPNELGDLKLYFS